VRVADGTDPSQLLDAMAEGLYVVDRDRVISHWNAAAEALTGFSADEVTGRWCGDNLLNHVDEAGEGLCGNRCPLLDTMRDGAPRQIRVYAHHRDGHLVPVRISARALRDRSGAITGAVETFTDDSVMEEANKRLDVAERLLMTDHLTGLGSRRFLERQLAERLRETAPGHGCGVLVVDIDRFKLLNDNHGHMFGDSVLATVGTTLAVAAGRDADVSRSGGDEFVIVTSATTQGELEALASKIRETVAETHIDDAGITLRVTVSVGAALSRAGDTPWTVVRRADDAMLGAKRGGRNRIVTLPTEASLELPGIATVVGRED
jgi:diguanylate cyclase (GGDEF)-like protein/PAS domain S-box-containing protein